jgi:hypothetical protein
MDSQVLLAGVIVTVGVVRARSALGDSTANQRQNHQDSCGDQDEPPFATAPTSTCDDWLGQSRRQCNDCF